MREPVAQFLVIDEQEGLDAVVLADKLGMPVVVVKPGTRCYLLGQPVGEPGAPAASVWEEEARALIVIDTNSGIDRAALEARSGWPVIEARPGSRVEVYAIPSPKRVAYE